VNESRTRAAIIAHLNAKVEEEDWAAVGAAANDLRLLEILQARSKTVPRPERQRRPGPLDA
jgi:hypothetical protein